MTTPRTKEEARCLLSLVNEKFGKSQTGGGSQHELEVAIIRGEIPFEDGLAVLEAHMILTF